MKRIAIFGVHFGYWAIYFLFTALFFLILSSTGTPETQKESGRLFQLFWVANVIPSLLGFYIFHYLVFYKIKNSIKWYKIVLISFGYCILIGSISTLIFRFTTVYKFNINHSFELEVIIFYMSISSSVSLIHGILGLFMRAFFDWFNLRKEKEQLTKQNHLIEMELVKAQLNPHFLFNSLNNIDVLIYKDQDQASAYLNKLSDIMRYMLFEAKTELISFETEYHFIEKYIALHQLRASNSEYVLLTNEIENQNGNVASLVFMPFIENAFKYSSSYKDGNAIQIQFQQKENQLYFSCKNRITKDNEVFSISNGLGNELLKKRLYLIYKEHYTLNLQEENGYFCVALTIPYEAN